ncbi:PREDICTED: collagen alpha-3(IV) chain-like, partial [Pseudopodoces humilis]|uniref:collagen alpha-3(IV) chain-like n=1 Tax=Pseudopodoces humilis TaxID=181119 RepID=UPI0006B7CF09
NTGLPGVQTLWGTEGVCGRWSRREPLPSPHRAPLEPPRGGPGREAPLGARARSKLRKRFGTSSAACSAQPGPALGSPGTPGERGVRGCITALESLACPGALEHSYC